jgi:hypothetical protein
MLIVCVVVFFSAIESNDDCAEEGKVFEYQEEGDQGQANQGKPYTCCISESYQVIMHCSTLVFLNMHCFSYIAIIPYIAIVEGLAPRVDLVSSFEMTPLVTYSILLMLEA